jgi:hypothetical protein
MAKSLNQNLHKAKNAKKDEFYTQLSDIENELRHYKNHFKNKVVLQLRRPASEQFLSLFFL